MIKIHIYIDGEEEIELMVRELPCRHSILTLNNEDSNIKYKVKVIDVECVIEYQTNQTEFYDEKQYGNKIVFEEDYLIHCETITE